MSSIYECPIYALLRMFLRRKKEGKKEKHRKEKEKKKKTNSFPMQMPMRMQMQMPMLMQMQIPIPMQVTKEKSQKRVWSKKQIYTHDHAQPPHRIRSRRSPVCKGVALSEIPPFVRWGLKEGPSKVYAV